MQNEVLTPQIIQSNQMLESIQKSEIDIQIATAKNFPRDVVKSLANMEKLAMMDEDTAADCFYALQRGGDNDKTVIEGISVRMAEIMASCWGNIRVQSIIVGHDNKKITAMASCIDLESNVGYSVQVDRRITNKNGLTFKDDMIVVTGNAASAIAGRNAVLKVIPKAVVKSLLVRVHKLAKGDTSQIELRRQKMIDAFAKLTVTPAEILAYLKKGTIPEIDQSDILSMLGLFNAIKEGTTSVEETFRSPQTVNTGVQADEIEKQVYEQSEPQAEMPKGEKFDEKAKEPETPKVEPAQTPTPTNKATKTQPKEQSIDFNNQNSTKHE